MEMVTSFQGLRASPRQRATRPTDLSPTASCDQQSEPVTIWPDKLDHRDRNKLRTVNDITCAANGGQRNLANQGRQRNNTSGCKGVTWDKARRKWLSQIQVQGRQLFLGRFTQRQQAFCVYQAAARKYFHQFAYSG